jgi:hypothetical protein
MFSCALQRGDVLRISTPSFVAHQEDILDMEPVNTDGLSAFGAGY